MKLRTYTLVCTLFLFAHAYAQEAKIDSAKRLKLRVLPSIFFTPETNWGGGLSMLGFITNPDTNTRPSNAQLFLDATLRKQLQFQGDWTIFTKENNYCVVGSFDLSKFPEFYYGIGNENTEDDRCLINFGYINGLASVYKLIDGNLYLGGTIRHQTLKNLNKEIEQANVVYGTHGYSSTGFGINVLKDERNFLLNPSEGHYILVKSGNFRSHSSQPTSFFNVSSDLRYYHTFKNGLVFNSHAYHENNIGVVPFRLMPYLGGPKFLRGYYAGRFRDNNLSLFRVEFRKKLFWRIGMAGFTGVGQVYSNVQDFHVKDYHYNVGTGLRFQLSKDHPANVRFDFAKTKDSHGFYIVFGESF